MVSGVWFVLWRIRKERAFDRRLEWHTSTLKVTRRFINVSNRYRTILTDKDTFLKQELIAEAAKELESCASDLRTAGFDVLPSSEDKAVKQLSTALSQIEAVVVVGKHVAVDSAKAAEPPAEYALLNHLLDDAIAEFHASLEGSINAQLGFCPKANQQEKNGGRIIDHRKA